MKPEIDDDEPAEEKFTSSAFERHFFYNAFFWTGVEMTLDRSSRGGTSSPPPPLPPGSRTRPCRNVVDRLPLCEAKSAQTVMPDTWGWGVNFGAARFAEGVGGLAGLTTGAAM